MKYNKAEVTYLFPDAEFRGNGPWEIGVDVEISGATIYPNVSIGSKTRISNFVVIYQDTSIGARCTIGSHTIISKDVAIMNDCIIGENVKILRNCRLYDNTKIGNYTKLKQFVAVSDDAIVGKSVEVGESTRLCSGCQIEDYAEISNGSVIGTNRLNVSASITVSGIGVTRRMTGMISDGELIIVIGCLNGYGGGTVEEVRHKISEKYADNHPYFSAIAFIEQWYKYKA